MRRNVIRSLLSVILTLAVAAGVWPQTNGSDRPLTNAAVLKLVRAGFKEKTIIAIINARPPAFELSPDSMIELKHSGVHENIILAMLNRQQGSSAYSDENWENDPFFQNKRDKNKSTQTRDQKETDIFGSSGNSQSNTKNSGGANVEGSGETQTTGTATVRIIRPPAEGGAPVKLEKTASLTNDSIIELVEAGFSDGTIIRRIEQSPVEFDLSPSKLADLRRHRVSDRIVAAMRAAIGENSSTGKTGATANDAPRPR